MLIYRTLSPFRLGQVKAYFDYLGRKQLFSQVRRVKMTLNLFVMYSLDFLTTKNAKFSQRAQS
jgi:hypothetical protein